MEIILNVKKKLKWIPEVKQYLPPKRSDFMAALPEERRIEEVIKTKGKEEEYKWNKKRKEELS